MTRPRIRPPWRDSALLRRIVLLVLLSFVVWRAVHWAMLPGFWSGSFLHNDNDTPLNLAERGFGPILLEKRWITDPDGPWGEKFELLREWGRFETAARLKLIIGVLWLAICVVLLIPKLRRVQPKSPLEPPISD